MERLQVRRCGGRAAIAIAAAAAALSGAATAACGGEPPRPSGPAAPGTAATGATAAATPTAAAAAAAAAAATLPDDPWGYFIDEAAIQELSLRLSRTHRPAAYAIEHVTVIAPDTGEARADQTVVVDGGAVRAVGPAAAARVPAGAARIDGRGRFVVPGLVDMHTHTNLSGAHYLLDLANGVTSIREMNGSPALLRQRAQARNNTLLVPNLYVAGKILASRPLSWYAHVVTSPADARATVRAQHADGYEFIKVHNIVQHDVYAAICDEARAVGLDVVGHIPHDITVARAIACGQRTFEHFKGYIRDQTLTLTEEDFVAATRPAATTVWNTPTFYNHRTHARGDAARRLLALPEMRFVAPRDKRRWAALADEPSREVQLRVLPLSKQIFTALRPIGARFLAGTDSGGGYPYHVPGFSLHEELRIMRELGLSPIEVLRTATTEPAAAMRREGELGAIAAGRRADLVLLRADPKASVDALAAIDGVMVRGIWLSRRDLDGILDEIARIVGRSQPRTRAELDAALAALEGLRARHHVLHTHFLGWLRFRLEAAGIPAERALFEGIAPLAPDED
jgi:imidazolonepropionase-like amidohydrolase